MSERAAIGDGAPASERARVVSKFGGTSVASADALGRVAAIVTAQDAERAVVVSATARTTDALLRAARLAEQGDALGAQREMGLIADRHQDLVSDTLGAAGDAVQRHLDELADRTSALLQSVAVLRECTARSLDAVAAYGAHAAAPIVAAILARDGVDSLPISATRIVVTDDAFGRASPLAQETRARAQEELVPMLGAGRVPVVTGYVGATREGVTTTLGRGGSDHSAAVLAAALEAEELLLVADVAGVLVDGCVVPDLGSGAAGRLIASGAASGGMVAKLEAALAALAGGVARVRIGDVIAIHDPTRGTVISRHAALSRSVA